MSTSEAACVYAALILHDDGIEITAEKISALISAAGVDVEPIWPKLFAKALEGKDLGAFLFNVGSSGMSFFSVIVAGSAPAASGSAPAAAGGAAAEAPKEEKKKEEVKEESDDDMGFEIPDLKTSDSSYNTKREDDLFRWQILLDIFIDAAKYGFKIGFSSHQMMSWLIILKESHDSYMSNVALLIIEYVRDNGGFGPKKCMEVFQSNLLKYSKRSERIFLKNDFERMIYYYRSTYAQQIRLITWTFSKSRGITWINIQRQTRLPVVSQPLAEAISDEHYDEWCKEQEEQRRKAQEEEKAKLLKLDLIRQEEEKAAEEAQNRAKEIKNQGTQIHSKKEALEANLLSSSFELVKPTFPSVQNHFKRSDIDGKNVTSVVKNEADAVKRELEHYIDQKLEYQSQLITEKLRKLDIVLKGKEMLKKTKP